MAGHYHRRWVAVEFFQAVECIHDAEGRCNHVIECTKRGHPQGLEQCCSLELQQHAKPRQTATTANRNSALLGMLWLRLEISFKQRLWQPRLLSFAKLLFILLLALWLLSLSRLLCSFAVTATAVTAATLAATCATFTSPITAAITTANTAAS